MSILAASCAGLHRPASGASHADHVHRAVDESIPRSSTELFRDDDALFSYVKLYGLIQTIVRLDELVPAKGDCHQPAHRAGRFAYEIYGPSALQSPPVECHLGGLHGAIEAYFQDRGVDDLAQKAKEICDPVSNWFIESQCYHGIGHGLMAWSQYELPDALTQCDFLETGKDSCHSGVFMENIVANLGHHGVRPVQPKYLNSNPEYPCTIVDIQYKPPCYLLQTSRMLQLFGVNFARIASACSAVVAPYQQYCYQSMGRDVGGVYRHNPERAIGACSNARVGAPRIACLTAAVQDFFWDPGRHGSALQFCRVLGAAEEKHACYDAVFGRVLSLGGAPEKARLVCTEVEPDYQPACLTFLRQ